MLNKRPRSRKRAGPPVDGGRPAPVRPDVKAPGRVAPPSDAAVGVQLSKSGAGLRDLSNPAQTGRGNARPDKIFLLFPLPVKVTTGGVNQG